MIASEFSSCFQPSPSSSGPAEELYYWNEKAPPCGATTVGAADGQALRYLSKESFVAGSENGLQSPLHYFDDKEKSPADEPLYYHLLPGATGTSAVKKGSVQAGAATPPVRNTQDGSECLYNVGELSSISTKDIPKTTPTLFEFSELPDLRTPYPSNQPLTAGISLISSGGVEPNRKLQGHPDSSTTHSALAGTVSTGSTPSPPDEGIISPKIPCRPAGGAGRGRGEGAPMLQEQSYAVAAPQLRSTTPGSSELQSSSESTTYGLPVQTFPVLSPSPSIQTTAPPSATSVKTAESSSWKGGAGGALYRQGAYGSRPPSSAVFERRQNSGGGNRRMVWQKKVQQPPSGEQPAQCREAVKDQHFSPAIQGQARRELAGIYVTGVGPGVAIRKPSATLLNERKVAPLTPPCNPETTVYRCRSPSSFASAHPAAGGGITSFATPTVRDAGQQTHGVYPTVTTGYVTYPLEQQGTKDSITFLAEQGNLNIPVSSISMETPPKQQQQQQPQHPQQATLLVQDNGQLSECAVTAVPLSQELAPEGRDPKPASNPSCPHPAQPLPQPPAYYYEVEQKPAAPLAPQVPIEMHYCCPPTAAENGELSEAGEGVVLYSAGPGQALSATMALSSSQQGQQETVPPASAVAPAPLPAAQPAPLTVLAPPACEVPAGYENINLYTGTPRDPRYMDADGVFYFPPEQVLPPPHLLCVGGSSEADLPHLAPPSQHVVISQPNTSYPPADYHQYLDIGGVAAPPPPNATPLVVGERSLECPQQGAPQPALLIHQQLQQQPRGGGIVLPSTANSFYQGSQELFSGSKELFSSFASSRPSSGDMYQRKAGGSRGYSRRPARKGRSGRVWCCSAE